jgi:rubrerythrin
MLKKNLFLTMFLISCLAILVSPSLAKAQESAAPAATAQEMAAPTVGTTLENLQAAFNGESNAHARYLAFAQKADEEGYAQVASLFRAAARAEQVHFEHHAAIIKTLGAEPTATIETPVVKSTRENLQAAFDGETYENTKMYPAFLTKAEADQNTEAVDAFEDAEKAEGVHASLYRQALDNLDNWKVKKDFMVCPKCGNVVAVIPGPNCPICGEDTTKFMAVS